VGKGTIYNIIARLVFLISGFAIHITMAYYLTDPRDYGTLGVILSMITIAYMFLSAGLPQATSKFIAQEEKHADAILKKALIIQCVFSAIVTAIYIGGIPLWTFLLNDKSLTKYILVSAILIPLWGLLQIYLSYFNGKRLFGLQSFFLGLYSVGRFVIAFVLVLFGMKIFGVLLGFIISVSLTLILTTFSAKMKESDLEYNGRVLINFAIPLILFSIGSSLILNLDILLLKHFFPDSPIIGYYTGAMNLGKAPFSIFYAFSVTVLPTVAKALGDNDFEKARGLVNKNLSYLLFLSIPSATMVLATSEKLLDFVYPSAYTEASRSLGILIFSMSALAVLYSLSSIITAKGKPILSMIIIFLCIPVQVGLSLFLIPRYQMNGAAYSNLLTVSIGVMIASFFVFKYFKTLFDINRIAKTVVSSLIIYYLLTHFNTYPVKMLPLIYGLSFVVFLVIMIIIGGITKSDIAFARRFISPKMSG
jgi:O-antigen/teichoic acid export membrane protein